MYEFFSWLRFVEFDENYTVLIDYEARAMNKQPTQYDSDEDEHDDPNRGFKAKDLPPLSVRNESKVILRMKIEAHKLLENYPTTLEQDLATLAKDDEGNGPEPLTENNRNAVLM